jgi:UDP-N-acetylglucosamine acyltransferase
MLADGNPARTRAINKVGLERNGVGEEARSALKQAYKILFREGLSLPDAAARIEAGVPLGPEILLLLEFVRNSPRGLAK